jgi:predicted PurR-regulated permease PerM
MFMLKWLVGALLLFLLYQVREVFPPFVVGAIFAYLLYPLVRFLNHRIGLAPFWSVLIIYSLTGTILGYVAWHVAPMLGDQAKQLYDNRREVVGNLVQQIDGAFAWNINVNDTTDFLLDQVQHVVGDEIPHLGAVISKSLLSVLICAITSIYMLVDNRRVGRFFMRFVPTEKRATVISLTGQMNVMMRKYVWGQLGLITLMSCIAFGILSFFQIKYALLIALTTGFLEIIPVLGPLLAILIASGFAVAQLGLPAGGSIPLCYWIARLIEDYIVVPNTIGHAVELHPLAVIFAVVVGETMAGALGMLIAIPVAASIKVIIDFLYPPEEHTSHAEKNAMAWMVDMFKRQLSTGDFAAQQAAVDSAAIQEMHSGSSRTGNLEADKGVVLDVSLKAKESATNPIPGAASVEAALSKVPAQATEGSVRVQQKVETAPKSEPKAAPKADPKAEASSSEKEQKSAKPNSPAQESSPKSTTATEPVTTKETASSSPTKNKDSAATSGKNPNKTSDSKAEDGKQKPKSDA